MSRKANITPIPDGVIQVNNRERKKRCSFDWDLGFIFSDVLPSKRITRSSRKYQKDYYEANKKKKVNP